MLKKKSIRTLIAILAVSVFVSTAVYAEPSSKEAQEKVDALKEKKAEKQQEVSSLKSQLTTILAKLDELETALDAKQKEIEQSEADLEAAKLEEKQQYEDMKTRIVYMYEEGTSSAELEKIMKSQSISDMLSVVEYAQNLHDYDRNKLDELIATKQRIQELNAQLKAQKAEMEELQAQYEEQSAALNAMIEEKSAEIADLGNQIQEAAKEVQKAKEREAAEALARAAAEARARAAAQAQAQAQNGANGQTGNAAASEPSGSTTGPNAPANPPVVSGGANAHGSTIVAAAYSQLGVPYVWGGTSPGRGLDCSGLTQYCYRCAGISIPRTSGAQLAGGTIVSNPSPGDICWTPGHVAIYIGNGQMIEAQQTGVPVKVSAVRVTYYVRY